MSDPTTTPEDAIPATSSETTEADVAAAVAAALEQQRAELEAKHALDLTNQRTAFELGLRNAAAAAPKFSPPGSRTRAPHPVAPPATSSSATSSGPAAPADELAVPVHRGAMLTLETLEAHSACGPGVALFLKKQSQEGTQALEWTPRRAKRTYARSPTFLQFLESRELVPMLEVEGLPSVAKRRAAILEARAHQQRLRNAPHPILR